mmetsp:Transcript_9993/g.29522  ORF Transcript_9993/g.29522 Transcript_9993/m.29522 type:complete len:122 (+) Transcript_9993:1712-2077(+)
MLADAQAAEDVDQAGLETAAHNEGEEARHDQPEKDESCDALERPLAPVAPEDVEQLPLLLKGLLCHHHSVEGVVHEIVEGWVPGPPNVSMAVVVCMVARHLVSGCSTNIFMRPFLTVPDRT